jgi:hypothetical protein
MDIFAEGARAKMPLEICPVIPSIKPVSFGCPDAGRTLARKSQGFGKICVESFPK